MKYPQVHFQVSWLQNGITDDIVEWTKSFGEFLTQGNNSLTTSQIRKFFGELKRIQADYDRFISELPMLKAHLAYAVGRKRGSKIEQFYEELSIGITGIREGKKEDFQNFVKIVEATVAYHKFYGGK